MEQDEAPRGLVSLTADIVSAFVSHNSVSANDLPGLISQVHGTLQRTTSAQPEQKAEPQKPAVPI